MSNVVVLELHSNIGVLVVELLNPSTGPGKWIIEVVNSGQWQEVVFDKTVPGSVLCGRVRAAPLIQDFGGVVATNMRASIRECGATYRHVGAGVVSCRIPAPGRGLDCIYVTLSPQPKMDGHYFIFGRIYDGMELLKALPLTKDRRGRDDILNQPIVATTAVISTRPKQYLDDVNTPFWTHDALIQQSSESVLNSLLD